METNGDKRRSYTTLELKPRRSIRVHYTPNSGRDYYTLSYYDEFGKRQRRLYPDRSIAEAEAIILRRKIDNGVKAGLLLNGRERLIYERASETARRAQVDLDVLTRDAADARAILGNASLADAARLYVEHRVKVISRTVAEVVEELVNDRVKNGKSEVYCRDLRNRLGSFASAFRCPISSVEPRNIEHYLDKAGATGRYKENLINTVGTLFNFARNRNYVHRSHPGIAAITKPSVIPREVRVLTPTEGRKLLLGVPTRLVPAVAISLFAQIRSAEVDRLDWASIDLRSGHIEIKARHAKMKVRRLIPLPRNLRCWLRPFAKSSGKVCPFKTLSDNWNQVAARAGVRWCKNIHRDSAISYAVAVAQNVAAVAQKSGNSPQVIESSYLKCVTQAQAKQWFSIYPPK